MPRAQNRKKDGIHEHKGGETVFGYAMRHGTHHFPKMVIAIAKFNARLRCVGSGNLEGKMLLHRVIVLQQFSFPTVRTPNWDWG